MSFSSVAIRRDSAFKVSINNNIFKVPLPRRPEQKDCNAMSGKSNDEGITTEAKPVTYGIHFLHLVQKLYTNSSLLTAYELNILRMHPVIGKSLINNYTFYRTTH
jgi:hypothetical protein